MNAVTSTIPLAANISTPTTNKHADIADDRQADDDLRAEAELHPQRGTELGVGPDIAG